MESTEIRIARRICAYMMEASEQQINLEYFKGLGISLAVCYEEMMGRTALDKKPLELLKWALDLPKERYPHVSSS